MPELQPDGVCLWVNLGELRELLHAVRRHEDELAIERTVAQFAGDFSPDRRSPGGAAEILHDSLRIVRGIRRKLGLVAGPDLAD